MCLFVLCLCLSLYTELCCAAEIPRCCHTASSTNNSTSYTHLFVCGTCTSFLFICNVNKILSQVEWHTSKKPEVPTGRMPGVNANILTHSISNFYNILALSSWKVRSWNFFSPLLTVLLRPKPILHSHWKLMAWSLWLLDWGYHQTRACWDAHHSATCYLSTTELSCLTRCHFYSSVTKEKSGCLSQRWVCSPSATLFPSSVGKYLSL